MCLHFLDIRSDCYLSIIYESRSHTAAILLQFNSEKRNYLNLVLQYCKFICIFLHYAFQRRLRGIDISRRRPE